MMGSHPEAMETTALVSGVPRIQAYIDLISSSFFREIEQYSDGFVRNLRNYGRLPLRAWPWPLDPLHTWSRQWEYPFAVSHLNEWFRQHAGPAAPQLLDVGSGLTFLPDYVHHLGWQVTCCDYDPRLLHAFEQIGRAARCRIDITGSSHTPYDNDFFDALLCISVLEHLPGDEQHASLKEMYRILRPGGLIVLTFDVCLDSMNGYLTVSRAFDLLKLLQRLFAADLTQMENDVVVMSRIPKDFVTTDWVRWAAPHLLPWHMSKRHILRSLLRLRRPERPFRSLGVCCLALTKPNTTLPGER